MVYILRINSNSKQKTEEESSAIKKIKSFTQYILNNDMPINADYMAKLDYDETNNLLFLSSYRSGCHWVSTNGGIANASSWTKLSSPTGRGYNVVEYGGYHWFAGYNITRTSRTTNTSYSTIDSFGSPSYGIKRSEKYLITTGNTAMYVFKDFSPTTYWTISSSNGPYWSNQVAIDDENNIAIALYRSTTSNSAYMLDLEKRTSKVITLPKVTYRVNNTIEYDPINKKFIYMAYKNIFTSKDGISWTNVFTSNDFLNALCTNKLGNSVVLSTDKIYFSNNANNWYEADGIKGNGSTLDNASPSDNGTNLYNMIYIPYNKKNQLVSDVFVYNFEKYLFRLYPIYEKN